MADNEEQSEPVMAGSDDATNEQKLVGIIEQVRQDHWGEDAAVVMAKVRERFAQAGVQIDDERLTRLVDEVSGD